MSEERFKWEMRRIRRSLEKGELKALLDELEEWNIGLKNCFEGLEIPSAESIEDRTVQGLHARFDAKQCDVTRENARALHEALQSSWGCGCSTPHRGSLHLAWHTEKFLAPARFNLALSYMEASASTSNEYWKQVEVTVEDDTSQWPLPPAAPNPPPVAARQTESSTKASKKVRFQDMLLLGRSKKNNKFPEVANAGMS